MRHTFLVVIVAAGLVFAGCAGAPTDADVDPTPDSDGEAGTQSDPVDGELEIHHLDVGQADATLLLTPAGETVLVDTGDWRDDGEDVVASLERLGIDRVDHLVTTHPDADHVGGHAAVVDHVEENGDGVGAVYDPGIVRTTATYDQYLDAVERHDVPLYEVREGDELPIEGIQATVLSPPEGGADPRGDGIVLAIEFGSFRYLTTGDAESDVERRLVDDWSHELAADVYQAGHHGSSTSSTPPFLDTVSPEVVVISSALDSQYGHPHDEVLAAFAERGIETYWTAVHGDVVVTTDGEAVDVETERPGPTDAATLLERKREAASASLGRPPIDVTGVPTGGR